MREDPQDVGDISWRDATLRARRIATRWTRSPADADEVAQEAVLRAWRNLGSLADSRSFPVWLATIVRREAFRHHQRHPIEDPLLDRDEASEDANLAAVEERLALSVAIGDLDPVDQCLIQLRYKDDLTYVGIALALDMPEGTVKVRLHRARKKLAKTLADHE